LASETHHAIEDEIGTMTALSPDIYVQIQVVAIEICDPGVALDSRSFDDFHMRGHSCSCRATREVRDHRKFSLPYNSGTLTLGISNSLFGAICGRHGNDRHRNAPPMPPPECCVRCCRAMLPPVKLVVHVHHATSLSHQSAPCAVLP
jgi:hypothetical protein